MWNTFKKKFKVFSTYFIKLLWRETHIRSLRLKSQLLYCTFYLCPFILFYISIVKKFVIQRESLIFPLHLQILRLINSFQKVWSLLYQNLLSKVQKNLKGILNKGTYLSLDCSGGCTHWCNFDSSCVSLSFSFYTSICILIVFSNVPNKIPTLIQWIKFY